MPTVTRITSAGTLMVNGSFDEITTSSIRVSTNTVFASELDEVTGMGFLPNMLTYFDAGKIESYNFNYDRQRLVDLSTSSRIVMQNTATWVSTFTGGLSYPVIPGTVSGTEPWIQLQDSVLNNRSSGTISAWIQYTAFSRSGDYHDNFGQALVSRQRDGVGTWAHLSVSGFVNSGGGPVLGTTGKIYWHPRNGIAPANSTANLAYNTVYHVAVTFNASECRFYINGVLDSTTAGDYSIPSSQEATFGTAIAVWRYGGEYYMPWSGYIYSMKFYNAALNPGQVAENYNADAAKFSLTPIQTAPVQRQNSTGRLAVSGMFDEFTGAPVVDSSLVLWLDASQPASYPGSGTTWTDLTVNGRNGTLTNGPTYSSANGGSIVFDGTDDYVQCTGSLTVTEATFVTWIRRNGNQSQYDGILFSRGTNVTGMNFQVSNQLGYHWNGTGNTFGWQSGLTIPDLTWCMVAVSVTSTAATAYLCQTSGITTATNTVSHTSSVIDDIKIAQDEFNNRCFTGNIAVAQLYNRALTADEITTNFNALRGRYGI